MINRTCHSCIHSATHASSGVVWFVCQAFNKQAIRDVQAAVTCQKYLRELGADEPEQEEA